MRRRGGSGGEQRRPVGGEWRRRSGAAGDGEEVHPLSVAEDAAVEGGANGTEDAVQRVRGEVQVGPAAAGVPASQEPHLRELLALQLPQEGPGDEEFKHVGPLSFRREKKVKTQRKVRFLLFSLVRLD